MLNDEGKRMLLITERLHIRHIDESDWKSKLFYRKQAIVTYMKRWAIKKQRNWKE